MPKKKQSKPEEIFNTVINLMDSLVRKLETDDYLETLELIQDNVEARIGCVKEEQAANE